MDPDRKATLIDIIGVFTYGKTNWLEFRDRMETCFDEEDIRFSSYHKEICLDLIGGKTFRILKAIIRPQNIQDDEVDYNMIVNKLETHFYPNPNRSFYVSKFFLRKQRKMETFFEYVFELRKLMVNCSFGKGQHSKLRHQIIEGAVPDLKEKFNKHDMSLSKICEIGLLWDDSRVFKAAPHPRNHRARKDRTPTCFRCKQSIRVVHNSEPCPFDWTVCAHCNGKGHISIACKYKDVTCNNCNKKGHIAKLCKEPKNIEAAGVGSRSNSAV